MIYKKDFEKEILHSGEYKYYKFAIYSIGLHPTAYVENKPKFIDEDDANKVVNVHGCVTFIGKLQDNADAEYYFGWDYCHCDDFCGLTPDIGGKKWTTQEIFDEVKACIDELERVKQLQEAVKQPVILTEEFKNSPIYKQIRKETAKEILQDLYNQANNQWQAIEWTTEDIKQYAKDKHGVEVDE